MPTTATSLLVPMPTPINVPAAALRSPIRGARRRRPRSDGARLDEHVTDILRKEFGYLGHEAEILGVGDRQHGLLVALEREPVVGRAALYAFDAQINHLDQFEAGRGQDAGICCGRPELSEQGL